MQTYLNELAKWCDKWGLCINPGKTYLQMFTRKRVRIPILRIKNKVIENKKEKRLLGLIFDAPYLTWSAHINYLKTNCIKRISLMKTFAYAKWGASMVVMRQFYLAYIQAKINYGSVVYASSADSHLQKLDIIQNTCMRMVLGARKSTPILSLQAESHIPPLHLKRKYLLVKEYIKYIHRPEGDYTSRLLGLDFQNICEYSRTPFNEKVNRAMELLGIENIRQKPTRLISQVPPWQDVTAFVVLNTQEQAMHNNDIFQYYKEIHWGQYQFIYTDGSKRDQPETSTACGMYGEQNKRGWCWKLRPEHSVISAELYGIWKALQYIEIDMKEQDYVVFTDSLSALQMIIGTNTKYVEIVNKIQNILLILNNRRRVFLHWIRSHSGITGNEIADRIANLGHENNKSENYKLTKEEWYSILKRKFILCWNNYWQVQARATSKGLALFEARNNIEQKIPIISRNRRAEIVIYRLRMGHVGVAQYLSRFNMKDTELCDTCLVPETVHHFLINCSKYSQERKVLSNSLRKMGITRMTLRCLLGGEQRSGAFNKAIINHTIKYVTMTGRIDSL